MKKYALILAALAVAPVFADICMNCCEHWIDTAWDLLHTGGFDDYVENVLMPHIRANCL